MKTLCKIAAIALPLTVAGAAFAGEPVALSDTQMDNVSAGASALALGFADAFGGSFAATETKTFAEVLVLGSVTSELTFIGWHGSKSLASATAISQ